MSLTLQKQQQLNLNIYKHNLKRTKKFKSHIYIYQIRSSNHKNLIKI